VRKTEEYEKDNEGNEGNDEDEDGYETAGGKKHRVLSVLSVSRIQTYCG